MKERDLFLMSDAALRDVIDMLDHDQLSMKVPAEWTTIPSPTLRDILGRHAFDEAWVPDLLAGKTVAEVGDKWQGDLLGDNPIESYDELNDIATEAVMGNLDAQKTLHMSYGDYPLSEGLIHLSTYRAFQSWMIARLVGMDFNLPDALVDALWDQLLPHVDEFRSYGVFPPEVQVPEASDKETRLLAKVGYWVS